MCILSGSQAKSSFYELADPLAVGPFRLRSRLPEEEGRNDGVDFLALSRGKASLQGPIQFDATQGIEATDIVWTQLVTTLCISDSVIRLLHENSISGWSTFPMEVFDMEGKRYPQYHGLAVTGAVCDPNYDSSVVVTRKSPASRGRSYEVLRGLQFDEAQWDGSHFFWVGGIRVVVSRVKEVLESASIENVKFVPLSEREIRLRHARPNQGTR